MSYSYKCYSDTKGIRCGYIWAWKNKNYGFGKGGRSSI